MTLPLTVVAPAVAATIAYLNARTSAWYDLLLLKCALTGAGRMYYREYTDRLNLFYVLESIAKDSSTADRALLIFEGKRYSYAQAYDIILRYGQWLRSDLGVQPNEIVALDFQNSDQFVWLWWGLWSIGAKPAFINYNLAGEPLSHCLGVATTKLCIIDPNVAANVTPAVRDKQRGIRFVELTPETEAKILRHKPLRAPDSDRSEKSLSGMAILIYTSGTTGLPKPAVVSWGKCIVGGSVAGGLLDRGNGDVMYTAMPLYHSSAAILAFCNSVLAASTTAIGRKFSTKTFWKEVRQSGATSIQYVGEETKGKAEMAHLIFPIFFVSSLMFLAALQGSHAVEYDVTNKASGTPGGNRFIAEIGVEYSRQTLVAATDFIWTTFAQTNEADRKSVSRVSLIIESIGGVAFASNNEIHVSANYIAGYSGDVKTEITGVLYHEMVHVWQWNGNRQAPGGLIEGIADYVRLKAGFIPSHWVKPGQGDRWDQGYDVTARFLDYCNSLRNGFVADLNRKMRTGYSPNFFVELLGKTVDQLWSDYKAANRN